MSLIWADFPSGSAGLYTSVSQMVGIWGNAGNSTSIVDDPSPLITGNVLRVSVTDLSDTRPIFAYPANVTSMIIGKRIWINNLPTLTNGKYIAIQNDVGTEVVSVRPNQSGNLCIYNKSGSLVDTSTSGFVMVPGSWTHVEAKISVNGTTLTYEVRLNGITILSGSYSETIASLRRDTMIVSYYTPLDALNDFFVKDIVYCNGSGSSNNTFLGTVSVTMQETDADISMPWGKSCPLTGHEILSPVNVRGLFSASLTVPNGQILQIDSTYYKITTGSVNAGTPAGTVGSPWLVAKGLTNTETAKNFLDAVNGTGVAGTTYSTALTAHATVDALGYDEFSGYFSVVIQSKNGVTSYPVGASSGVVTATAMGTQLRVDIGYISAGLAQVDTPAIFGLTDMPSDITSVKGLISVARMMKVDGGDATAIVSLGDGTSYADGTAWPVTTAPAYYIDVCELNPTTNLPWSPVEANAARIKLNRTV